jgi:hypothetical protein
MAPRSRRARAETARRDYFARVAPVLGEGLAGRVVAVDGLSLAAPVVELLASCGLDRVLLADTRERAAWPMLQLFRAPGGRGTPRTARGCLARYARWKNRHVPLRLDPLPSSSSGPAPAPRVDLWLVACLAEPGAPAATVWDEAARRVTMHLVPGDLFSCLNVSTRVARTIRDLLLGRAPWPRGALHHGAPLWPFAESEHPLPPPSPAPAPRAPEGAHLLVVGCGSVGSEAVRLLATLGARFTLVDGARVSPFNPVRQWFGLEEVGRLKVRALAARLAPARARTLALDLSSTEPGSLARFEALLDEDRPDLALLATGTADHGPLAEALFRRGVPHVAACAYPRARFFEAVVVLPGETPCLHCYRGHLFRGAEPPAPVDDELARFLYAEPDERERERLYLGLVAEPATRVETARIADVASHLALEALAPRASRAAWFRRLVEAQTTVLLGGNTVVETEAGTPAYGLTRPGQVVRLGREDLAACEAEIVCRVCGRRHEVAHRLTLGDAAAD